MIGGWQLQAIVGYRSGLPYTPTMSRDVANIGVGGQRPNRIGSGTLDNPTIDAWFDKSAFVVPANFTFGDSGPGILRSDHQWNLDLSLFKRFDSRSGRTRGIPRRGLQHAERGRTSTDRTPTSIPPPADA